MFQEQNQTQCRLCMKSDNFPVLIFDPHGTDGILVWEVIIELVEFQISKADELPPTICRKCMRKLLEFKHFKNMCINSRIEFMKKQLNRGLVVGDSCQEDGLSSDGEEDDLRLYLSSDGDSDGAVDEGGDDSGRCDPGGNPSEPMEKKKGDNCGPLGSDDASTDMENVDSSPEEEDISRNSEVLMNTEEGDDFDTDEHSLASRGEEPSEGESEEAEGGVEAEDSNLSGGNSIVESAGIEDEEESHKTGEDDSLCEPRRTRTSARIQAAKRVGDAQEKRRGSSKEDGNALLKAGGSEEKEPRRRKGMKKTPEAVGRRETMPVEWREKQKEEKRKRNHEYYAKLSEEEKKAHIRRINERTNQHLAQMNVEERKSYLERKRNNGRKRRMKMTEKEKKEEDRRRNGCRKNRIAKMSAEERKEYYRRRNEKGKKMRANMSEEERKKYNRRQYENQKRRIASLSEEEREQYLRRKNELNQRWLASLSDSKRAALLAREREQYHKRTASLKMKKASASALKSASL